MNEQSCANCAFFKPDTDANGNLKFDSTKECKYRLPRWAVKNINLHTDIKNPNTDGQFCEVFMPIKEVGE